MRPDARRMSDRVFADQTLGDRDRQEDAVAHQEFDNGESVLLVLADGMGGHQGGEVAARTTVDSFISGFFTDFASLKIPYRLFSALVRANKELDTLARKNVELEGMGSTLLAATCSPMGLSWLSVGDSLLLRVRGRTLHRLNEDHSMAPVLDQAVKNGTLTREQAASNRDRNALRSAVTGAGIDLVDISDRPEPLWKGDVVLLASDGLLTLKNDEIVRIVRAHKATGARAITGALLEAVRAKKKRRQDNTTIAAIIVDRRSSRPSASNSPQSSLRVSRVITFAISIVIAFAVGLGLSSLKPVSDLVQSIANEITTDRKKSLRGSDGESRGVESVDISGASTLENTPVDNNSATPNINHFEGTTPEGSSSKEMHQKFENDLPDEDHTIEGGTPADAPQGTGVPPKRNDKAVVVTPQSSESGADVKYPKMSRSTK